MKGYRLLSYDANVSAKKINEKRLQRSHTHEQSNASPLIRYLPHAGLMASYGIMF